MKKWVVISINLISSIILTILIGFNILSNPDNNLNKKSTTNTVSSKNESTLYTTYNITTNELSTTLNNKTSSVKRPENTTKKNSPIINNQQEHNKNNVDINKDDELNNNVTTTTLTTTTLTTTTSNSNNNEDINVIYKYGVKITKLDSYKYDYDFSGYNASTNDLKKEGLEVSNSNLSVYNEMLNYVNDYRNERGINILELDKELCLAATIRAIEMAWSDNLSHTRPNNLGDCFTIYKDLNISYNVAGENIAMGQRSVSEVSLAWKNSPGHYENMIRDYFNYVGFGKYELNGKIYWAQLFK